MPGGIFVRISVKTLVTSVCRACFYSICVCQWLYFLGQLPNLEHRIQWNAFRSIFGLYLLTFFVSAIKLYFNFPFSCCVILNYHSAPLVQSSTNKADLDQEKNEVAKLMIIKYLQDGWRVAILMKCIVCICLLQ